MTWHVTGAVGGGGGGGERNNDMACDWGCGRGGGGGESNKSGETRDQKMTIGVN